jgi:hypothetical protein
VQLVKTNNFRFSLGRTLSAILVGTLLAFSDVPTVYAAGLTPGDIVISAQLSPTDYGLLVVDPTTGNRTILSDNSNGTGPAFSAPEGVTLMTNGDLLVGENGGVVEVDPSTGNRTIISSDSGVGSGPLFNAAFQARQFGSRILVTSDGVDLSGLVSGGTSGIMSVDPVTGNRSWLSAVGIVGSGPRFSAPAGFVISGTNLFVADFGLFETFEVDTITGNRAPLVVLPTVSPP